MQWIEKWPSLETLLEGLHMGLNRSIGEAPQ